MTSSNPQSEWFIAGNGAIGSALAYRLHHQSVPVTLFTRDQQPEFVDLSYQSCDGTVVKWSCPTRCEPDGRKIQRLVIATKAYSVQEVLRKWSPSLDDGAAVYMLQNGFGFDVEDLPESAHPLFVVNGGFTAYLAERNHVVQSSMEPIWIGVEAGDPSPCSPRIEEDLKTLDDAGFHVRWTPDIVQHRWAKIGINSIVNSQAVLYDIANGALLDHSEASANTRKMCEELGALFESMSVELSADRLHEMTITVLKSTSRNICSTLQDYRRGTSLHELGYINLPLLEEARARGISMPVKEEVYARVTELFSRNKDR